MTNEKKKQEAGMITVEAVLSLVPFILVIMGIISFINVFMVHNKIQYAIYQVGSELSAYTYFYEALAVRNAEKEFQGDADKETEEIDKAIDDTMGFIGQIDTLSTSVDNASKSDLSNIKENLDNVKTEIGNTKEAGKEAVSSVKNLLSDPKDMARNVVYLVLEVALDEGKTWVLGEVSRAMISGYLDSSFSPSNPMTADEYLRWMGVENGVDGLVFDNSKLFADEEKKMIDIVVEYDLKISFFKLFLKDPTVHVVQRCAVPAWLDGDGVHYTGE
ncbi:MAG: pilus assembly protein [Lachnospiraceae bacterium]|nr:pilus assembly protein [Lachnospiraceae bacterium]